MALCYFYVYFLFISSCNFGIQHTLTADFAYSSPSSWFESVQGSNLGDQNLSPNGPYCLLARVQERRTGEDHCAPMVSFVMWRSTPSPSRHHLILHFTGAEWLARGRGHADVRGWLKCFAYFCMYVLVKMLRCCRILPAHRSLPWSLLRLVSVLTTVAAVAPSHNMEHLNQNMIEKHGYDNMTWLTMHWSLIAVWYFLLTCWLAASCLHVVCKELQWLLAWSFLGLCCCSSRDFLAAKSQEPIASVGGVQKAFQGDELLTNVCTQQSLLHTFVRRIQIGMQEYVH